MGLLALKIVNALALTVENKKKYVLEPWFDSKLGLWSYMMYIMCFAMVQQKSPFPKMVFLTLITQGLIWKSRCDLAKYSAPEKFSPSEKHPL